MHLKFYKYDNWLYVISDFFGVIWIYASGIFITKHCQVFEMYINHSI